MLKFILVININLICLVSSGQNCTTPNTILTGYDNNGTKLNSGVLDLNWEIVQDPDITVITPYYPKVFTKPIGWGDLFPIFNGVPIVDDYNVIAPSENLYYHNQAPGVYIYETRFCLNENVTSVLLNYKCLADNRATIYLNGHLIDTHDIYGNTFFINNGFKIHKLLSGVVTDIDKFILNSLGSTSENILQIHVTNMNGSEGEFTNTGLLASLNLITDSIPPVLPCDTCVTFKPEIDTKYWISGWVKINNNLTNQIKSYAVEPFPEFGVNIEMLFIGSNSQSVMFFPSGDIIDGWQRVVGQFTVPIGTNYLDLNLNADKEYNSFFDDIRIHPFNASMKSYVYDGETFWLTSELDDNNYATFYEYDNEGGLVRIKKETARGIVTIQETRSGTVKIENTTED